MSMGFERRGLNMKLSDVKDFTNCCQVVAGDEDAVVGASAQAFTI